MVAKLIVLVAIFASYCNLLFSFHIGGLVVKEIATNKLAPLFAKKNRKSGDSEKSNSKGFGQVSLANEVKKFQLSKPQVSSNNDDVVQRSLSAMDSEKTEITDQETGLTESQKDLFQKYGIPVQKRTPSSGLKKKKEDMAFGEEILNRIPPSMQTKLDNILITLTFLSLSFVVSCGIGISVTAYKVVFPTFVIPENVDAFIKDFLSPSFTPSLGVFFLFSITLGLFKFAQISSNKTIYKESG